MSSRSEGSGGADEYPAIRELALIGDCHGTALVSSRGTIEWACPRRFDASPVFASLLDRTRGGRFDLTAVDAIRSSRAYLPDTNVLETTFTTRTGTARILDCFTMRIGGRTRPYRQLLRVIEGIDGEVAFDVRYEPRFDYGALRPWLRHVPARGVFQAIGGDQALVLSADAALTVEEGVRAIGRVVVQPGERCRFSMVASGPHEMRSTRLSAAALDERLDATIEWWRAWVAKGRYATVWRDEVVRSALVLKLLTCAPTGSIVAAPTTSLPERIGGTRNWDYRYCWIRDATLALAALLNVGHPEVATGFKRFIERATAGHAEDMQILYGCYGERRLTEITLADLEGFCGSGPVRAGNDAATQRQLDLYGEVLDAAQLWRRAGNPLTDEGWRFLASVVEAACAHWSEPDRGIWEVRGPARHFVFSKAMCWRALQRGIDIAEEEGRSRDALPRWRRVRDQIRAAIDRDGVDPRRGCFVMAFGGPEVDASLLRLPVIGFVDPCDPRMTRTVEIIEQELCTGGFVRRYPATAVHDGIDEPEGAFLLASFWLVDVLAMRGDLDEAERRFRALLALANDVGLFAEEYDPDTRAFLGNFPQAYTHMAVINSAQQILRGRAGGDHAQPMAERAHVRRDRAAARDTGHHRAG